MKDWVFLFLPLFVISTKFSFHYRSNFRLSRYYYPFSQLRQNKFSQTTQYFHVHNERKLKTQKNLSHLIFEYKGPKILLYSANNNDDRFFIESKTITKYKSYAQLKIPTYNRYL